MEGGESESVNGEGAESEPVNGRRRQAGRSDVAGTK